jgi:hypothetical protein
MQVAIPKWVTTPSAPDASPPSPAALPSQPEATPCQTLSTLRPWVTPMTDA